MTESSAQKIPLHGGNVRCHVCGAACYIVWVDRKHHGNKCVFGDSEPYNCPNAQAQTENALIMLNLRARGHLTKDHPNMVITEAGIAKGKTLG